MITRPIEGECMPYFWNYINLVPEGDYLEQLQNSLDSTAQLLAGLSEEKMQYRYAEGKWNIREMIIHIADAERIFAYRALRISRGDITALASFDENAYVDNLDIEHLSTQDLMDEWRAVRAASIHLYKNMTEQHSLRKGVCSDKITSVRALAYMLLGHELHHVNVIKERYL